MRKMKQNKEESDDQTSEPGWSVLNSVDAGMSHHFSENLDGRNEVS